MTDKCPFGLPWWGSDNQSHVASCILDKDHEPDHEGWVGDHKESWPK